MFVRDLGSGPVVLCLHGTPSPADDWMPLADALSSRYRVLVPDLPGYGKSAPLYNASMGSVGDAIVAMVRDYGVDRLHTIVGYSTGAYRAFDVVSRHPSLAPRLIVTLAGIVTLDQAGRDMRIGFAEALEADPGFLDSAALQDVMRQLMLSESWRATHPEDERRVMSWPHTTTAAALAAECRALAAMRDLRPELRGLTTPVYARVGALDVGAPPACSEEIVSLVANGSLDVVPGCGHGLLIEDLAGTVDAIATRIGAAEASPSA